jgi:predicted dehydrogenase
MSVRLGIIGIGNMGIHHARMVDAGSIPGCRLAAVCDTKPERLKLFPQAPAFRDAGRLFSSGLVDAVLIATPHYSHTDLGIQALKKGLHVLVEKPLSVQKSDALRLIRAHTRKKQVFAAVFNQRTDPCYQKIRGMVRGGELGRIQRIQWTITDWFRSQAYYDSGGWRATWAGEGGGVLLNQAVHNLDLYQWIFGLPQRVRAVCSIGRHHRIEVEDEVTAIFEHAGGATGVFVTSTGEAPGINRLEIAGDRGRLTLEHGRLAFCRNEIPASVYSRTTREGYRPPAYWNIDIPVRDRGEQHAGILKNFANAILKGDPLVAPAKEGLASVELINSMILSSFENRPVGLPLSASRYAKLLARLSAKSKRKTRIKPYRGSDANYLVPARAAKT